ncbi:hypothetical protein ACQRKX_001798 [Enterobacter cloacae]
MEFKTERGTLLDGVPFNDTLHMAFEIRLPTMKITCEALDAAEEKTGSAEGMASDAYYRAALFAGSLLSLGNIPAESLTPDLLYEYLTQDDYDQFDKAVKRLKEKRNGGNPGSPDSGLQPSPSDSTASPNSK